MDSNTIEIEVDGPSNASILFLPIARRVRGKFDYLRVADKGALGASFRGHMAVPGQIIGIDPNGRRGFVREPLHDASQRSLADALRKQWTIPAAVEYFENINVDEWSYWMRRAVDGGHARQIQGTLPAGMKPPRRASRERSPIATLAESVSTLAKIVQKQDEKMNKLIEAIHARK